MQAGRRRQAGRQGQAGRQAGRQADRTIPFEIWSTAIAATARAGPSTPLAGPPARDIMPPRRSPAPPLLASLEGGYTSASIPDAQELARNAANASTLGTPAGFAIPVAVLNIGLPAARHYSAQPWRRREARPPGSVLF